MRLSTAALGWGVVILLGLGCGGDDAPGMLPPGSIPPLGDDDSDDDVDDDSDDDDSGDDATPCPPGMAAVDAFCIDRFEGALEDWDGAGWMPAPPWDVVGGRTVRAVPADGVPPQGYISGDEAAGACAASGKRLCTSEEWLAACSGADGRIYPYGDAYDPSACNDTYGGGHPVVDFFGHSNVWDTVHMNDPGINQQPGTLAAGGAFAGCGTPEGVFDLHGNLHEWVADASGVFRGGFYADAVINGTGCSYRTTAHATSYHDYSTGFRCCADPD